MLGAAFLVAKVFLRLCRGAESAARFFRLKLNFLKKFGGNFQKLGTHSLEK